LLEGADIIYGVGSVDAGSSISFPQVVLDDEIIAGLRRMMEGIQTHGLEEEVALIKERTPRGNFLNAKHTKRTFREHWLPGIFSRDTYEAWQASGETIEKLCRSKAGEILAQHRPAPLPSHVEMELEYILQEHLGKEFHLEPLPE
jgi:trimethylamine:corrinoid methyltransferase-like protein